MEVENQSWLLVAGRLMVLMALAKHLIWAWLLLVSGHQIGGVTSLKIPIEAFGGTTGAGIAYAVVSMAVMASLYLGRHDRLDGWQGFLHLSGAVGQQFLLMISAAGSFMAIWNGAYLDGTVVPRAHLAGDQDVYILLAIFHPLAVLVLYVPEFVERVWDRLWAWTDSKSSQ